ncbi:pentatricopeptide repeat-containing protein At1g05670, mitochondrial-like [Magnolia sinica]|uniref:pentatricopeptide repeat-containing protein At1g05670, mitochondrial-like n=1 Tax=Magnolia sinica TaxID=86752 RepID=UPI002659A5DF|nr:pentatricopeptide repeat-containing protein At1g05670, mitochondrial-like [Magnolia sinica]
MMHKHVECYVDDLVVRSEDHKEHCEHLTSVFHRLKKKQLKMNPAKCAFGVSSGKFLDFIARHRGIEIDPRKVRAIQNMPPLKTLKELKSLQGKLLLEQFCHVEIKHISLSENARADALASLAVALSCPNRSPLQVTIEERRFLPSPESIEEIVKTLPVSCLEITTDDWRQPFIDYLKRLGSRNSKLALDFFEFTKSTLGLSHSVGTYNCLIRVLCETGLHKAAKSNLDCMMIDGHSADNSLLRDLVFAHALAGNYDSSMDLLVKAEEYKCRPNSVMYNNLLNLMVKKNRVEDAVMFSSKGHFHPDTCIFNIVIKGLCKLGDVDRAFKVFSEIGSFDCCPDIVDFFDGLANWLTRLDWPDFGFMAHTLVPPGEQPGSQALIGTMI